MQPCIKLALVAFPALLAAGPALAKVPYFAAKCPTDISVETSRGGAAYINGKKAVVRSKNADYSEISGSGVTVSVARDAGSLIVSYTGKHGVNGICQVVEQEKVESAPPAPAPVSSDVPARDKRVCMKAVKVKTNNSRLVVLDAISSEANNTVTIGVGRDRAKWRCLVKRGIVADVMSLTNEGGL